MTRLCGDFTPWIRWQKVILGIRRINTAAVYLLKEASGAAELLPVNISMEDGALTALQGEPVATYPLEANLSERHYFSFSGDGRKLAVGIQDNTGDVQVAVLHYNLINHVLTPLQEDNLQDQLPYFYSMIWGPDQNSLYFISKLWGNNMVGAISLGDGSLQTQDINYQASLIQGVDEQVYLVGADKDVAQQVQLSAEGLTLQDQDDLALGTASDATFTGRVPEAPLQITTRTPQLVYNHTLGRRHYELTDHLGNVRAVVTDQRLKYNSSDETYYADLYSSNKYYPFGMLINAGLGNSENYRYGFNGKEKDDQGEWGMTAYDYGFRIYNPGLGRFLSVDPLTKGYPMLTPYQFASNRPIDGIDLDGLEYVRFQHLIDNGGHRLSTKVTIFYKKSDAEILTMGGTTAGKYNVASYGPKGEGIQHQWVDLRGNVTKENWDMPRDNLIDQMATHGLYSGGGSIRNERGDYDFSWQPIDIADAIAKQHDMDYDAISKHPDGAKMQLVQSGTPSEWICNPLRSNSWI